MMYIQKQSSRRTPNLSEGFSAVELLITLFIAAVFFLAGFQLYVTVINNGGEARMQSSAANIAAGYLQQYESSATSPCTPGTPVNAQPTSGSGLTSATVTVTITCPYITSPTFSATGGTITTSGGLTVHTFTSPGTFTVNYGSTNVQYLVVGGGGQGGRAGGGGGGGILSGSLVASNATSYAVTVGSGGNAYANEQGANGGNSTFSFLTASGGGGGAGRDLGGAGFSGGSGGGGGGSFNASPRLSPGAGLSGQGNSGGTGAGDYGCASAGGGGGGASSVGGTAASGVSGNGGSGMSSSITGSPVYYGGGGGGSIICPGSGTEGTGGAGGGGAGGNGTCGAGLVNTGGGGGGGACAGGSGIVIISYPTPVATPLTNVSKIVATVTYGNAKTVSSSTYVSTSGIVTNGLTLNLDAGSNASYPDVGTIWTDLGPNGNNCSLINGVGYSSNYGGLLTFNGTNNYIDCGNSGVLDLSNQFTISGWVKWTASAVLEMIMKNNSANTGVGAYEFFQNGSNVTFRTVKSGSNSDLTSATAITAGTWVNIVAVYNGSTKNIYINAVQDSNSQSMTPPIDITTGKLTIGAYGNATYPFNGSMGSVQIYNRALSSTEITQNFNALRGRYGL